jgi:hypothetical protein
MIDFATLAIFINEPATTMSQILANLEFCLLLQIWLSVLHAMGKVTEEWVGEERFQMLVD